MLESIAGGAFNQRLQEASHHSAGGCSYLIEPEKSARLCVLRLEELDSSKESGLAIQPLVPGNWSQIQPRMHHLGGNSSLNWGQLLPRSLPFTQWTSWPRTRPSRHPSGTLAALFSGSFPHTWIMQDTSYHGLVPSTPTFEMSPSPPFFPRPYPVSVSPASWKAFQALAPSGWQQWY